jgi:hypothetical protein
LYPRDFRDEMGSAVVEDYRERVSEAFTRRGSLGDRAGPGCRDVVRLLHRREAGHDDTTARLLRDA